MAEERAAQLPAPPKASVFNGPTNRLAWRERETASISGANGSAGRQRQPQRPARSWGPESNRRGRQCRAGRLGCDVGCDEGRNCRSGNRQHAVVPLSSDQREIGRVHHAVQAMSADLRRIGRADRAGIVRIGSQQIGRVDLAVARDVAFQGGKTAIRSGSHGHAVEPRDTGDLHQVAGRVRQGRTELGSRPPCR